MRTGQLSSFLHDPWDGFIILGLILATVVTLAPVESFLYAASPGAAWTLVGVWTRPWFGNLGDDQALLWYRVFWWLHYITVFGLFVYLPRSTHSITKRRIA